KIPTAKDVPMNDVVSTHIVEVPQPDGPFNAKGLGEAVLTPTAPAISNAIFDAVGVRMNYMPITPERLLSAIRAKEGKA
ncbi:MAG: nicotinate dehydrogenase medium molybdopterin subunit, partial [Nitrospinota bacterium]